MTEPSPEVNPPAPQTLPASDAGTAAATAPPPVDAASDESKLGRKIKIGTQRPGAIAPRAKPLPLPSAAMRPKPRVEGEPAGGAASLEGPRDPRSDAADDPVEAAMAEAEMPDVAAPRVAIPSREKVERPNRRQLSPELEHELAEALGDMSLEDMVKGESAAPARPAGDVQGPVRGRIVSIHRDDVFIELGQRNQGVLSQRQFPEGTPPVVGAELEVVVGQLNAEDGLFQCSLPGGPIVVEDWSQLADGTVVEATITGHNKGGLECQVQSIRGFIPAGQISLYRVEDFSQFVGQKFNCVVTEANPRRKNLILSRRAVLEREKAEAKEKMMSSLAPGQVFEGVVRKVMDFGAFVDLGGVDGLVHVSRMSWQRVRDPRDILKEGERVRVQVEKIDPETHKIGLSMREFTPNPWSSVEQKYPVKSVVHGPVTKIMDFGAFVELEPGVEGLVHISELAHHRVFRVGDVVKEGQEVDVEVQSIDREKQRISLSMKSLLARPVAERKEAAPPAEEETPEPPREPPKKKIKLKGGLGRSTGSQFGLKW